MKHAYPGRRASGFSLVEVMVALLVISVGILGIAKMQALALANTGGTRMRSIAAIEAAGLASALHGDRSYWAGVGGTPLTPFSVTMNSTDVTAATDTRLQTATVCATAPDLDGVTTCSAVDMAAFDLHDWLTGSADGTTGGLGRELASAGATLTCYAPSAGQPVGCIINVTWREKLVSANTVPTADAPTLDKVEKMSYQLFVQP